MNVQTERFRHSARTLDRHCCRASLVSRIYLGPAMPTVRYHCQVKDFCKLSIALASKVLNWFLSQRHHNTSFRRTGNSSILLSVAVIIYQEVPEQAWHICHVVNHCFLYFHPTAFHTIPQCESRTVAGHRCWRLSLLPVLCPLSTTNN